MTHASTRVAQVSMATMLVVLAGCKVGPNYAAPQPQSQPTYSSLEQIAATAAETGPLTSQPTAQPLNEEALATWWKSFNDPTLDSLVQRAINQNLDLKVAAARVREARAIVGVSESGLYPSVAARGSAERLRNSENTTGGSFTGAGEDQSSFVVGLDAAYEIDVFGGVRRGIEASRADYASVIENQRDVMITMVAEVGRTYIDLRGFQRRVNLSEQIVRAARETVELTKSRFNAGLSSDLEVAQAEAQLAQRESLLPTYRAGLRASAHRLGVLLGQQPGELVAELLPPPTAGTDVAEAPLPTPPSEVPVGLPSELLQRRPDIRRAERNLAAATARIGVATAELYPRFSLTGSFGLQSAHTDNFLDMNSRFWSIGPAVRWNLFQGGAVRAQIEAAGAREEQALYAFDQTILLSVEEVENALTAFIQEQSRRAALQTAVDSSQRAVDLSMDRYRSGVGDFLNVLVAQRALYDNQDQLVQSETAVTRGLIGLYKALGGGWSETDQAKADEKPGTNGTM